MEIALSKPIGVFAVLLPNGTAEVVKVDNVVFGSMVLNAIDGTAMFILVLGGIDSTGTFRHDPSLADAAEAIHIQRRGNERAWDARFGTLGKLRMNFPPEWFSEIAAELIEIAARQDWADRFPDVDFFVDGVKVDLSHLRAQDPPTPPIAMPGGTGLALGAVPLEK